MSITLVIKKCDGVFEDLQAERYYHDSAEIEQEIEIILEELISEAKTQGISRATVIRWNDAWQEQGMVSKIEYGHYRKAC